MRGGLIMNIRETIRKRYNEYIEQNGTTPKYAIIGGKWRDNGVEFIDNIKIGKYSNEDEDSRILYYVSDIEELCSLNDENNAEFYIVGILCFSNNLVI